LSLDCEIRWNPGQDCFVPVVDEWGETSIPGLFVAGDGAGIAGARAAQLRGTLAGIGAAMKHGRLDRRQALVASVRVRRQLNRELAIRPFLDALFKPRMSIFQPADPTIVCRCEEISAGEIRAAAIVGLPGANQIKAATRAGMGPCQGRQCGYSVTRILAEVQNRGASDVGYFRVRPPLKPVTLGELAGLNDDWTRARRAGASGSMRSDDPHVLE
jgi:NADPH-dependent 2,4-dienoyl-CoA reductase/sulfur reductase-like enzyme